MSPKQWNFLAPVLIAGGSAGVLYGMVRDDHIVFLAGLPCLIFGYLMVRKKLKEKSRKRG